MQTLFAMFPDWLLDGDKDTDGKLEVRKDLTPNRYCQFVIEWVESGANLIGGCCGTTAEHIKSITEWLEKKNNNSLSEKLFKIKIQINPIEIFPNGPHIGY